MARPLQVVSALGAAIRNENVRRVELAWGASIATEWAHFVALGVFAYQQGGTSAVGVAGLVRLLPAGVLAPFAASLGDRFRRERFLMVMMLVGRSPSPRRPSPPLQKTQRSCSPSRPWWACLPP